MRKFMWAIVAVGIVALAGDPETRCLAAGPTEWVSTTNYELKGIAVVVREEHLQEALRQFIGEKTCTGVSEWTYDIYLEREDTEQKGHWITDETPSRTGKVKLCKGQEQ